MGHVTIHLSEAQGTALSARLADTDFDSLDDYVAALIDAGLGVDAQERLEAQLLEGLKGERRAWTPEVLDEIRRRAHLIP